MWGTRGVFSYSATFHGSAAPWYSSSKPAMAIATYTTNGYWIVTRDGGVFSFGNSFEGSYTAGGDFMTNIATRGSTGYWLLENDGDVIECVNVCVHP